MSVHQNTASRTSGSSLIFSVTDQGDADDLAGPSQQECVDISPELVRTNFSSLLYKLAMTKNIRTRSQTHLSRFSELYITAIGKGCRTKSDVCRHNASVAGGLNRQTLKSMWMTLAIILEGSETRGKQNKSALSFVLMTTVQNLLLQRADAGDVQTCVVLCEVMDAISPPVKAGDTAKSALPNIEIEVIREWYLSYIDLLQQMCLFTQAASLIRNCKDPVIGALNQQSTT